MGDFVRVRRWVAVSVLALVPVAGGAIGPPISAGASVGDAAAVVPSASEDGSGPGSRGEQALVGELQQVGGGSVSVHRRLETGAVSLLGGSPEAPLTTEPTGDHGGAARRFVDRYGPLYGVDGPGESLVEDRRVTGLAGGTAVRFRQEYAGLPVFGAEVSVQVGADGRVLSSLGDTVPVPATDTSPSVAPDAAATAAVALVSGGVVSAGPELVVYDPVLLGAPGERGARLVWKVGVSAEPVRELVLVDAHTGVVALHFDQTPHAKDRQVCDNQNNPALDERCVLHTPTRVEGAPPTGVAEVDAAYVLLGSTYDYYLAHFGRDSWDGWGYPQVATVRNCVPGWCPWEYAYWNHGQVVLGDHYAVDDVVGHEFTHGLTQSTSNLVYYAQSGAISESMSDVLGELIDQGDGIGNDSPSAKWLVAEGAPNGPWRNMADPVQMWHPDRMSSEWWADVNYDFSGVHTNSGVGNKAAFLISAGGAFNGQSVAGIGPDKTALLFFEADAAFLGPSSVYADLGSALTQACANLVGTHGFTTADCQNVAKAVVATEMAKPPSGSTYHPLTPARILDSRDGTGLAGNVPVTWGPGESRRVNVLDVGGVPGYASSVVLNVTVTGATAASHLTVWPSDVLDRPMASNVNFVAGQTIANLVTVRVGTDGWLSIYNSSGFTHVIADVVGYSCDDCTGGVHLTGVTPFRVLDSRDGVGAPMAPWSAGESRDVQVTGVAGSGVPATGVTAVVLNVTAVWPTAESFVSVWPTGVARPLVSNLNFPAQRTIPNLVVAKVGAGGKVSVYNNSGEVHVVADVVGYYSTRPSGGRLTAITPARILDSRPPPEQVGPDGTPWGPGQTRTVTVAGVGGVAPEGVSAVVLNVTAVNPSADSHLTVWNTGVAMPMASNLNFRAGDVIPNLVVVKVGTGNTISIYNNSGSVDVLADVVGYFN